MTSISNIVNVNASIITGGLLRREFGITLFVTKDDTLPSNDPLRIYSGIDDVASDFADTSAPYLAAQVYFAQEPYPKNFMVGRWLHENTSAILTGGTLPSLPTLTAITDGSLELEGEQVTGMDFSSAVSYSDIANVVETQINASAAPTVTVTYDATSTSLIVTTVATGSGITLTYASSAGTGTDVSDTLALDSATAISLTQGADGQTIQEAMENFQDLNDIFYFITLDPIDKDTQTVIDLSTWVFDRAYIYYAESSDAQTLVTDDLTSNFALLFAQQSRRTSGDYTPALSTNPALYADNIAVSSAARLSSVNFDGTDTLINPGLKNRPLIFPSTLTTSQETELDRKLVNRLTPVGGGTTSPTIENKYFWGYSFENGVWIDITYAIDWFVNAVQVDVFDLLSESDRIPQTIEGQTQVVEVIRGICDQAIRNGMIAPGELSAVATNSVKTITGNSAFNGVLSAGYLIYPQPLSTLSESNRIARKLPPFYVWLKGSGAVNYIDISILFDQ